MPHWKRTRNPFQPVCGMCLMSHSARWVGCLLLVYACAHGEELAYQRQVSRRGQEECGALCRVRLVYPCVHLPGVGAVWHAPGCLFRHAGCARPRGGGGICLVCFQLGTEGEVTHLRSRCYGLLPLGRVILTIMSSNNSPQYSVSQIIGGVAIVNVLLSIGMAILGVWPTSPFVFFIFTITIPILGCLHYYGYLGGRK